MVMDSSPPQNRIYGFYAKTLVGLLLAVLASGSAFGHDFWIEPTRFMPAPGDEVELVLRVGQDLGGDTVPYIDEWFSDYRVITPDGPVPVDAMLGDDPAGMFVAGRPGLYLVAYRSTRDFVELAPGKFNDYLRDEGLERFIDRRAEFGESGRPAREWYSRCAKSLLRVGAGGPDDAYALNLGYTLELIPARNPYALRAGEPLPVTLLYEGLPLPGALVIAFTADRPADKITARTAADGRIELPLGRPGLWLVKAVHMIRIGNAQADWESFWASLTFRVPAGAPAAGGG